MTLGPSSAVTGAASEPSQKRRKLLVFLFLYFSAAIISRGENGCRSIVGNGERAHKDSEPEGAIPHWYVCTNQTWGRRRPSVHTTRRAEKCGSHPGVSLDTVCLTNVVHQVRNKCARSKRRRQDSYRARLRPRRLPEGPRRPFRHRLPPGPRADRGARREEATPSSGTVRQGVTLLIIDELGYVPLSQTGSEHLFDVFSQRYENVVLIVVAKLLAPYRRSAQAGPPGDSEHRHPLRRIQIQSGPAGCASTAGVDRRGPRPHARGLRILGSHIRPVPWTQTRTV